ncbi:NAD(P)H-dependent oxidoreductase [Paenibacillus sp. FSL H7-0331]|uniref:NAD(P)H-dependent oxidoreductase n=1 Tax=Paenibacillus sp. FSL H7-0331 TaxID=1920421 RepID=UPI00096DBD99|nr:NAD(P)H-dependent oxidoreductase [Paenibacillus sp. FSL H7-0331]OME97841.1 FMN-dependent NADH-azoreductase [Paenibacillus sp. FSL H7-0331]
MATVLYITAHPLDHQDSYSLSVGKEFINEYREANPTDEVLHLDLYQVIIPQIDADVFSGWRKLSSGTDFNQLSTEEKAKVSRLGELVDQFVAADKYVFINPMWNFSFPSVMKAYIDSICVAGKTFKYVQDVGPVGLLGDKKAVHIQAAGNFYSQGGPFADFEIGHRHLTMIMKFFGVPSFEGIFIEGVAVTPDQAPSIKEKAIQQARELARKF